MRTCILLLLCVLLFAGRSREAPHPDAASPRLVTFSPALTQLAFDIGLGDHVVGVTSYCRLPEGQTRTVVGNQLNVRVEPILAVRPDVILAQTEQKYFEPIRRAAPSIRVETVRIETLEDIGVAMKLLGRAVGDPARGAEAAASFAKGLQAASDRTRGLPRRRVLFVMGFEDPSSCGAGTFIHDMIGLAGGENVMGSATGWVNPDVETLAASAPQVVICQCKEGEKEDATRYWLRLFTRKEGAPVRVVAVSDDRWTIPGSHLATFVAEMVRIVRPELDAGASAP